MSKISADKIQISICLSDIPKSAIQEAKNGKKYINLDILAKRETDQYGKNINVALSQTKEQREAKADAVWLGSGKTLNFNSQPQQPQQQQYKPSFGLNGDIAQDMVSKAIEQSFKDDLPF
jgi:hypothetical protein